MVQMHELLTAEEIEAMAPKLSNRLLELAVEREGKVGKESQFVVDTKNKPELREEVIVPLVRWVISQMIREGKPSDGLPYDYTHIWTGQIASVLMRLGMEGIWTNVQRNRVARQITIYMKSARLAENTGYRHQTWFVRKMPLTWEERVQPYRAVTVEAERQQAKHPPEPVTASFDLEAIPFPKEITPDSLVEYVAHLTNAYNVLNAKYVDVRDRLADIEEERDRLFAAIEALEHDEWEQAALRIRAIVAGEEKE